MLLCRELRYAGGLNDIVTTVAAKTPASGESGCLGLQLNQLSP